MWTSVPDVPLMPYLIDDTSTLPNALHGEYSSAEAQ